MIQVQNQIVACGGLDNTIELDLDDLQGDVVHRLSLAQRTDQNPDPVPDKMLTSIELCRRFTDKAYPLGAVTGWRRPYHVGIFADRDATIEQMLPLGRRGMHAKGYNYRTLSVCVIGNSDQRPPTVAQYDKLIWLLCMWQQLKAGQFLKGHDELHGAMGDPNKRCPGRFLPMAAVREHVEERLRHERYADPRQAMEQAGFVF